MPSPTPSQAPETTATFTTRFYSLLSTITERSAHAANEQDLDHLRTLISQARQQCSGGTEWWVGYDLRKAQDALFAAEQSIDTAAKRLRPRQRFRFRQRPTAHHPTPSTPATPPSPASLPQPPIPHGTVLLDPTTIHHGVSLAHGVDGQDVTIRHIKDARIVVPFAAAAVRLLDVQRCTILLPRVHGSVHGTRLQACRIWVRASQLRLHECIDCTVWTQTAGDAVIEQSTRMRFGTLQVEGEERGTGGGSGTLTG